MVRLSTRLDEPEWLDAGLGSSQEVQENLAEMDRINRWLGGDRALLAHLAPRLADQSRPVTVLDLGTGAGWLPIRLSAWASRRGLPLTVIGIDWSSRCLDARPGLPGKASLTQADALHPPLAPDSVDYVISSLFLHHFSPPALQQMIKTAYDLSRCGLVMSDLVRGWLPLAAFRLVGPVFATNRLTRHDGALSIRRAYRPDELLRLAVRAGLPHPQVHTHWPWRMTLIVDK